MKPKLLDIHFVNQATRTRRRKYLVGLAAAVAFGWIGDKYGMKNAMLAIVGVWISAVLLFSTSSDIGRYAAIARLFRREAQG